MDDFTLSTILARLELTVPAPERGTTWNDYEDFCPIHGCALEHCDCNEDVFYERQKEIERQNMRAELARRKRYV